MAVVVSPASLQQVCEAAASAWLVQWSGVVGQTVTTRGRTAHEAKLSPSRRFSSQSLSGRPRQCSSDDSKAATVAPVSRATATQEEVVHDSPTGHLCSLVQPPGSEGHNTSGQGSISSAQTRLLQGQLAGEQSQLEGQVALQVAPREASSNVMKQPCIFPDDSDSLDNVPGRRPQQESQARQNAVSGLQASQEGSVRRNRMYKSERKTRVNGRSLRVKYETQETLKSDAHRDQGYLSSDNVNNLDDEVKRLFQNVFFTTGEQASGPTVATRGTVNQVDIFDIPEKLHEAGLRENLRRCSEYLKSHLPPLLLDQIISAAWRNISKQVAVRNHKDCIPKYQVSDWIRRAPVVLLLASSLSRTKFLLNISGIPSDVLEDSLNFIHQHFPLEQVNKMVMPKMKFKSEKDDRTIPCDVFKKVIQKTTLMSLTLNSNICDNSVLSILCNMSLQELDVGGSAASETGIIRDLSGLPMGTASEVVDAVRNNEFWEHTVHPLRKSLVKLSLSFQNVPNLVYQVIPIIFLNLQYYNPHTNMINCVRNCARTLKLCENNVPLQTVPYTLRLLKMNIGHARRDEILELSRACPDLKEISLSIDLDCEETLNALETHKHLSNLELAYYPSFPSPPKLDGRVLFPLIRKFKSQLDSLSLTGFNLTGTVLHELSQLPELRALKLGDCWLSNPDSLPHQPFPCLENLSLHFLPQVSTMQLFTCSSKLTSFSLDLLATDWEGNALTDSHIKSLVVSGMISSVQSFSASSPHLTLASVRTLSSLPFLRSIGRLALWGLTEEELHCVGHSGPPHIHCLH